VLEVGVTYSSEAKVLPYEAALREAGVRPVRLRAPAGSDMAQKWPLGGLVLTGGTDLNPRLYGQERHPATEAPEDGRDAFEAAVLREALALDLPVLAICRGMQLFNVVHGGSLAQHHEGHRIEGADAHAVRITPGTLLARIAGSPECPVNSRHHQVVERVGAGLTVAATAPDGVVEALERPDRRFALAVQWHPEDRVHMSVLDRALFAAFARAVGG